IAYIEARVRVAGGDAQTIFTAKAIEMVHERSRGIPRTISVICDNALVSGFALDQRPVDEKTVLEVCEDYDFAAAPDDLPDTEVTRVHEPIAGSVFGLAQPLEIDAPPAVVAPGERGLLSRLTRGRL